MLKANMSLAEVAKRAGVSPATVCRVLRQTTPVRPETVEQVRAAMREINFVAPPPRAPKRRLKNAGTVAEDGVHVGKHQRVAVITIGQGHKYWLMVKTIASFVSSLTASARELDVDVLLDEMPDPHDLSRLVRRGEIGGAVVLVDSALARSDAGSEALRALARELPIVWAMGGHVGPMVVDHVAPDNVGVGHLAAGYLAGLGCERVAVVTNAPTWSFVRTRAAAFAAAANDAGATELDTYLVGATPRDTSAFCGRVHVVQTMAEAAARIAAMPLDQRPQGVFATTDNEMALLQPQLAIAGIVPARDVHLVSCDNDAGFLSLMDPKPATMDLQTAEIARQTIRRLRQRMRHPAEPPVLINVPPVLLAPSAVEAAAV